MQATRLGGLWESENVSHVTGMDRHAAGEPSCPRGLAVGSKDCSAHHEFVRAALLAPESNGLTSATLDLPTVLEERGAGYHAAFRIDYGVGP